MKTMASSLAFHFLPIYIVCNDSSILNRVENQYWSVSSSMWPGTTILLGIGRDPVCFWVWWLERQDLLAIEKTRLLAEVSRFMNTWYFFPCRIPWRGVEGLWKVTSIQRGKQARISQHIGRCRSELVRETCGGIHQQCDSVDIWTRSSHDLLMSGVRGIPSSKSE